MAVNLSTTAASMAPPPSPSPSTERPSEFDETMRDMSSILQNKFPDIKIDIPGLEPGESRGANFLFFMCSLIFGMVWITYITFFNSRVVGKVLTRIANRFVGDGYVKIGSLSWSVLPGKVMFRDVAYVNKDYTVRVQDGFVIFRWWRSYVPKDVTEDLSHSDTRVSMQLYGFECHIYNRTPLYKDLARKFGYEFFDGGKGMDEDEDEEGRYMGSREDNSESSATSRSSYILGKNWRDLIPVIKVDMSSAKFVFGNKLLPTTLVLSAEEAHCTYSTKPAGCQLDHFMHFVKSRAENFKVLLAPSPKYTGLRDEAPRYMGEGFVLVSSNSINLYYYMDEAGVVPLEHETGDPKPYPVPEWGVDIKCGKGTDFSYGPWADRQRELIYKFFFPPDYRPMAVTQPPRPGERRQAKLFRLRLSTEHESTVDVLFSNKQKETSAVHVNVGQGTNFELKVPWWVGDNGYAPTITGTLMMVEATTSLPYREFLTAETLQFKAEMKYPLMWNEHQLWNFSFVGTKTSLNFIFAHKWFFQDLIDDWSSKSIPDLIYFVPYTWSINLALKQYELITPTNEFNWMDTSSANQENSHMGICGDSINLAFDLPYTEFLPTMVPFHFDINGENVDLVLFLPETNTSHDILYSLDLNAKIVTAEGKWKWKRDGHERKWRSRCKYDDGWIDCWSAPSATLQIDFLYHPMPPSGPPPQANQSTPEKEQKLLTPLRAPSSTSGFSGKKTAKSFTSDQFEPDSLEADKCCVRLYVGRSTAFLYGTLVRSFMQVKENLFGEDQRFTPMDAVYSSTAKIAAHDNDEFLLAESEEEFDPRLYRPIDVVLDLNIANLHAHLLKNCSLADDPCPFAIVEQVSFEMDKSYRETRLQLLLSPIALRSGKLASAKEEKEDGSLPGQGHLLLSGLQFRGHAMFSELNRPLGSDTLEYGWLIEVQCGSLVGKISAAQLYNVMVCAETFVHLLVDKENVLKHPRPYKLCQHGTNQKECPHASSDGDNNLCCTVEEVKYRLVRFLLDSVDVYVTEKADSAMRLQACPIRLSACNLHGRQTKEGVTALVNQVRLQQYISSNFPLSRADLEPSHHQDIWVETGNIRFGPVFIEGAVSTGGHKSPGDAQKLQHEFLKKHDSKTKRLWFLWPNALMKERAGKCGCVGGCNFFGNNSNGVRFFQPRKGDVRDKKNVALPCLKDRRRDPCYSQSILHDNQLLGQGCGGFGVLLETLLPPDWPDSCHEPEKLPFCPDYRTHKSNSSHNSSDTPKHPKYHRSFSTKTGTPVVNTVRKRSISSCMDAVKPPPLKGSAPRLCSNTAAAASVAASVENKTTKLLPKATSMTEVQSAMTEGSSQYTMERTESLVSDVLSFYSLEDEDAITTSSSKISYVSPKSTLDRSGRSSSNKPGPRSSSSGRRQERGSRSSKYDTAVSSSMSPASGGEQYESCRSTSITSTIYDTASQGISSPSSGRYDTASQNTSSAQSPTFSFDTPTLQPEDTPTPTQEGNDDDDRTLSDTGAVGEMEGATGPAAGEDSATLSRQGSSASFISAVSEHRDFDLVDLHMQVNKPITDSPLLMSSYISHLTQLRCSWWRERLSVLAHETQLSGKVNPDFDMLEEGFSIIKMKDKIGENDSEAEEEPDPSSHLFEWDSQSQFETDQCNGNNGGEFISNLSDSATSKATVIVKFKGAIDVICCPILLQSLEKTLDSLASTFKSLHPVDVINHLHTQSVDLVESRNTLKKERSLDLQEKLVIEPGDVAAPKNKRGEKNQDSLPPSDMFRTFEKSISSYMQASINLPKVNVMVLQASVVEEMCAFSALDRVRDITCVSLLALGIQGTTFQFSKTSQSKKTVQIYIQHQRSGVSSKKFKKSKYKIAPDLRQNEPFTFESSETQREEILMNGSLRKMHAQLRRLRNDSSILKDASITAIPGHRSKVFFEYVNVPRLSSVRVSTPLENRKGASDVDDEENAKIGYNMCECGFEGISLKIAKRSCNQDTSELQEANLFEDNLHVENEVDEGRDDASNAAESTSSKQQQQEDEKKQQQHQGRRSTASGSAEFKTTWFNFAAPPKTPISKKIDFTKLDWNLLSTASPSIDAWLGPIDRLQEAFAGCLNNYHQRVGAVMASLMADALDVAAENFLKLTKYDKLTALSKTLRDDPSCQLCSILLKYLIRGSMAEIEANLDIKGVPPLTILRQGIVVLSRQWKNALYTPILIEYNLRCKNLKNIYSTQVNLEPVAEESSADEDSDSEQEANDDEDEDEYEARFDEGALLLKSSSHVPRFTLKSGSIVSDISATIRAKLSSPAHFGPAVVDDFVVFEKHRLFDGGARGNGSVDSGGDSVEQTAPNEMVTSGDASPTPREQDEALYYWMKRQQDNSGQGGFKQQQQNQGGADVTITVQAGTELKDDAEKAANGKAATPQTTSMHLLDAHIIFEPLLSSLGLMPQQIQNLSLKNLGYNVSVLGSIEEVKVDIVESEFGKKATKSRGGSIKREPGPSATVFDQYSPAFLCRRVFLQTDVKKVTDIDMSDRSGRDGDKGVPLYMTRAQLKRHTSSLVNFSINVQFISQRVNMPLLRLVNQIATMHQNVKETNEELREQRPEHRASKEYMRGHKKNSSGSSTSSNISAQLRQPDSLFNSGNVERRSYDARRPMMTPSPSTAARNPIRNRPKSFAQKFRPNSRLAGYSSLESPLQEQHDSFILTSAPLEMITEEQTLVPCWKTMYNLLELYSTMPTTKTVQRQSLTPVSTEAGILQRASRRATTPVTPSAQEKLQVSGSGAAKTPDAVELPKIQTPGEVNRKIKEVSFAKADATRPEHTPLIVFGIVRIERTQLSATLSGLKLEGEIRGLQTSMQYREKIRAPMKGMVEASVIGNMEETKLVLLEGPMPNQQTVVKVTIGKSQVIHTSHMWKTKDKNSGTFAVDLIHIEIPQHPVDLHSIVTRGTKELSSTLQEFRGVRILQRGKTMAGIDEFDGSSVNQSPKVPKREPTFKQEQNEGVEEEEQSQNHQQQHLAGEAEEEKSNLIKPFVMQFHIVIHELLTSAALLPSLQAEYCMKNVTSRGATGGKAKFVVDLPKHTLSFNTKLQEDLADTSDANLPSEASIALPKVQVLAEYVLDESSAKGSAATAPSATASADGSILSQGSYLKAEAEIGELEHFLTTDLLNHLVFVQKVFMREVNDVVQKMSGSDRPVVPIWGDDDGSNQHLDQPHQASSSPLLFSVAVRLKNITVTATTPANSGVRFETGFSELHISNRVQNIKTSRKERYKIFTKAKVNIRLSLGQLIRDPIYYEAERQFQQQAYFKTTIYLRNAFQGENDEEDDNDADVIYITLHRPLIFVHPVAVDRAILFWLSYKNAWEYWTEQRLNLNKEVLAATAQVLEKVPLSQITSQLSTQHVGTIFLQLNVQDIGLCVPFSLEPVVKASAKQQDTETMSAIVATVESSSISACSARSTVSKGKFKELCVRFSDDFNHFLDDWKPDRSDPSLINLCFVSEGSYEICSQTTKAIGDENAKWLLHIQWQMTGVDVHVDTNIGKHLSALANTLTTLAGEEEEEEDIADENSVSVSEDDFDLSSSDDLTWKKHKNQQINLDLPPFLLDPNLEKATVAKYLEHEINEQAKTVEDLQKLGASEHTVVAEVKKLNELQSIASKNFRQDLAEKLRRQKSKASYFKEKFGLGAAATTPAAAKVTTAATTQGRRLTTKSKSICGPPPSSDTSEFARARRGSEAFAKSASDDEELEAIPEADLPRSHKIFLSRGSTIDEDDEEDASSNATRQSTLSPRSGGTLPPHAAGSKAVEPNVDFEFHVKIFINSGKCVVHSLREEEKQQQQQRSMKKDRSFSGNIFLDSPNLSRKLNPDFKHVHSSTRLRDARMSHPEATTTFFIPGLDTRVHYISKTEGGDEQTFLESSTSAKDLSSLKKSSKKATLTAWMALQSIPEETIISPTILEFLEQVLAPIPTFNLTRDSSTAVKVAQDGGRTAPLGGGDQDEDSGSGGSQTGGLQQPLGSYAASFPVDVIVYFHMQSSTFRFSCLPVSRVECMLRLPSLNLVFSSKRADGEIHEEFGEQRSSSSNAFGNSNGFAAEDDHGSVIGGLSITGCLNDFSLYMFHPYGGGRKQRPEEVNFSPLTSEERRDSLSVNVAFVKFHISRSRKLKFGKISLESSQRLSRFSQEKIACVRFSTVVDIGSASFKYDIRRLSEILAFPKAWYRRTLVRRLFLGELKTTSFHTEAPAPGTPMASSADHHRTVPGAAQVGARRQSTTFGDKSKKTSSSTGQSASSDQQAARKIWIGQTTAHSWETLVMTTLKFKELKVQMNMGNVMGNVEWVSKDFRAGSRLSISSSGHKNLFLSLGLLDGSHFEARSGIVGGAIAVGRIETFCRLREDRGIEPFHKVGLRLDAVEVRCDYMSSSVLMGRISNFCVALNDDWHVTDCCGLASTSKPAQIFVQGELTWDQLQILISKSTTADLLKIGNKLEEFFSQQFKSSKKLFSSLEPGSFTSTAASKKKDSMASSGTDNSVNHHRHWQKALSKISGMKIYTLPFKLPTVGSVLGGVMELRGRHFSLACFHGINFKSKAWALFSLKDPSISFVSDAHDFEEELAADGVDDEETEAKKHVSEKEKKTARKTTIIQTLSLSLGQSDSQPAARSVHHGYMATVKKISRSVGYQPPIKSLPEWFNYAFRCSELDEVSRFPSLSEQQPQPRESNVQQKTEEIFALPCLRMDLKTKHVQGEAIPTREDPKPVVDCTFVTDFDNHIYVTTDAESFFFLHDLITSYVKEKERVRNIQQQQSGGTGSDKSKSKKDSNNASQQQSPSDPSIRDFRLFQCNTWHLEPTVRLISWAASEIEPYGVDYILRRLGFSHERTTIPKWLQRGCMDPLDKALSVIVLKTIQAVKEEPTTNAAEELGERDACGGKKTRDLKTRIQ